MTPLIECLPTWKEVCDLLDAQQSIFLIAPRHYGKRVILERLARRYCPERKIRCVVLSSEGPTQRARLDYRNLWVSVSHQLKTRKRLQVTDSSSFATAFRSVLDSSQDRFLALISGGRRGNEDNHGDLVALFNRLLSEYATLRDDTLTVVATDDYSLFFYDQRPMLDSELFFYRKLHWSSLTAEDIAVCLSQLMSSKETADLSQQVFKVTGGHPGLVLEILQDLHTRSWQVPPRFWENNGLDALRRSHILESLNRALDEDPKGYTLTALEYVEQGYPERSSPRIFVLRQLGILQRTSASMVRLCPGAIKRLVEVVADQSDHSAHRIGTLVSAMGERIFEDTNVDPTDDDLVVVHLSDLHVSPKHRFRFSWPGGIHRQGEPSASELLFEDLNSLNLIGKVDALVLSGDVVWNGGIEEFQRARTVITEILDKIKISKDRFLVIPGNHDMEWNPSGLAGVRDNKHVSREKYDLFLELLGKGTASEVELLSLVSRSGRRKMRILGLDSNRVEGPESAGIGYVSRETFTLGCEYLKRDPVDGYEQVITWIAVHHHVFPATSLALNDAQQKNVSVMGNSVALLDNANQWQVEVILHGHEHQPSVTVARRWPLDTGTSFYPITTVGAGSFGVDREYLGPFSRNHYYILYRRVGDMIIRSRCIGESGVRFVPHNDIILPRHDLLHSNGMPVN